MIVLAAVLLRMGLDGFSREALLAREVGLRQPIKRAAAALRTAFMHRPGLFRLLWHRRIPLSIAAAGLPIGAGAGFIAGLTGAIPGSVVKPVLSSLIRAASEDSGAFATIAIFSHNVLAFAFAVPLAILTAGVSGFLLTFAPGFLLGYAASQSSWSVAIAGVLPNGLVEIPAAIIAGGLAIHVGAASIHMEPSGGWTARVLTATADYLRALRWLIPALAVAALLEVRLG